MELIKEIVFDRDSEKIVNWADFIYELVKEKKVEENLKLSSYWPGRETENLKLN